MSLDKKETKKTDLCNNYGNFSPFTASTETRRHPYFPREHRSSGRQDSHAIEGKERQQEVWLEKETARQRREEDEGKKMKMMRRWRRWRADDEEDASGLAFISLPLLSHVSLVLPLVSCSSSLWWCILHFLCDYNCCQPLIPFVSVRYKRREKHSCRRDSSFLSMNQLPSKASEFHPRIYFVLLSSSLHMKRALLLSKRDTGFVNFIGSRRWNQASLISSLIQQEEWPQ